MGDPLSKFYDQPLKILEIACKMDKVFIEFYDDKKVRGFLESRFTINRDNFFI